MAAAAFPDWRNAGWSAVARARQMRQWALEKVEHALGVEVGLQADLRLFKQSLAAGHLVSEGVCSLLAHDLRVNITVITAGDEGADALQATRYIGETCFCLPHRLCVSGLTVCRQSC